MTRGTHLYVPLQFNLNLLFMSRLLSFNWKLIRIDRAHSRDGQTSLTLLQTISIQMTLLLWSSTYMRLNRQTWTYSSRLRIVSKSQFRTRARTKTCSVGRKSRSEARCCGWLKSCRLGCSRRKSSSGCSRSEGCTSRLSSKRLKLEIGGISSWLRSWSRGDIASEGQL